MNKQKPLSLLTAITMMFTLATAFPATVHADDPYSYTAGAFTITSETELTADDYIYEGNTLSIKSNTPMTISGTTMTDTIVINDDADITLAGVNIDVSDNRKCALKMSDYSTGDVTITLADGTKNTLKSDSKYAGLQKLGGRETGTLTIRGGVLGTGKLTAIGGSSGAGIGGSDGGYNDNTNDTGNLGTAYNITISGGVIIAEGGVYAAGIGSGTSGNCGNISITGGTVTATGYDGGAGIGCGANVGYYGAPVPITCENIVITGGSVKAMASLFAVNYNKNVGPAIGVGAKINYEISLGFEASDGTPVTPTSDGSTPVYRTTLNCGSGYTGGFIALNGFERIYGQHTDDTKLYFYLPKGTAVASYDDKNYKADVKENNSNVFLSEK